MPPPPAAVAPDALVAALRRALGNVALVYLFGSEAAGTARSGSDLDVAFLADASPDPMERFAAQEDLARALGREAVDLVDLRAASTVMKAEVLRTGRLLFERSRPERDRFEMHACSAYALLNEERRGILDDIQRRGSVYGPPSPSNATPSRCSWKMTFSKRRWASA